MIVQAGKTESISLELRGLEGGTRVGYIRERVAAHCKEAPEKVLLFVRRREEEEEGGREGGGFAPLGEYDRLDCDGATLEDEGLTLLPPSLRPAYLFARRHDVAVAPSSSSSSSLPASVPPSLPPFHRTYAFDLLTPPQLEDSSNGSSPNIVLSQETWLWQGGEEGGREGGLPPPPLPHKADAVFCGTSSSAGDYRAAAAAAATEAAAAAEVPLAGHFKAHPEQLNQLLTLLELDSEVQQRLRPLVGDMRAAVWEILQVSVCLLLVGVASLPPSLPPSLPSFLTFETYWLIDLLIPPSLPPSLLQDLPTHPSVLADLLSLRFSDPNP